MPESRRTFGPVLLAGLASAALAAWLGGRRWAAGGPVTVGLTHLKDSSTGFPGGPQLPTAAAPVVTALAFVVLASWGVVLVTRGVVRRALTVLTLLAALGMLVAAVAALVTAPDRLGEQLAQAGLTSSDQGLHRTVAAWIAVAACVVAALAAAAAVRFAAGWPAMGSRYDAPGSAVPEPVDPREASGIDWWRALDRGHDPTVHDTPAEERLTDP